MGGEAKKAEFMGDEVYLGDKRPELQLGLNFFGEMEKKLDDSFSQAAQNLQEQVSRMIEDVFPAASAPGHMSTDAIRDASLGQIIGSAAQDSQLQLIKTALTMYFKDMPLMDQRAMMAAGTRYCVYGEGVSQGAKLGAILKGAGPVMQKMLQGLDPSMFAGNPDFQLALGDIFHAFQGVQIFDLLFQFRVFRRQNRGFLPKLGDFPPKPASCPAQGDHRRHTHENKRDHHHLGQGMAPGILHFDIAEGQIEFCHGSRLRMSAEITGGYSILLYPIFPKMQTLFSPF
jgi:hypothetical protein